MQEKSGKKLGKVQLYFLKFPSKHRMGGATGFLVGCIFLLSAAAAIPGYFALKAGARTEKWSKWVS